MTDKWEEKLKDLERIDGNKLPGWVWLFISQLLEQAKEEGRREKSRLFYKRYEKDEIRESEKARIRGVVEQMPAVKREGSKWIINPDWVSRNSILERI